MQVILHKVDGGWERVHQTNTTANLGLESIPYLPRKTIIDLSHALILPPTNIGHESHRNSVSESKLNGSVGGPSAWLVDGHIISPAQYHEAFRLLNADERYLIDSWLSTAKQKYTIGGDDAMSFVQERQNEMDWDEIREEALKAGGLKTSWRTEPLFRRHAVTPVGLAFWRLAIGMGLHY